MTNSNNISLMATDRHASVTGSTNAVTCQRYTPFGFLSRRLLPAAPLFNGQLSEAFTAHYLLGNGYRAYDPTLMRFISPDSISPFGRGGINYYAYGGGDPINFRDPTGHVRIFSKRAGITSNRLRPISLSAQNLGELALVEEAVRLAPEVRRAYGTLHIAPPNSPAEMPSLANLSINRLRETPGSIALSDYVGQLPPNTEKALTLARTTTYSELMAASRGEGPLNMIPPMRARNIIDAALSKTKTLKNINKSHLEHYFLRLYHNPKSAIFHGPDLETIPLYNHVIRRTLNLYVG